MAAPQAAAGAVVSPVSLRIAAAQIAPVLFDADATTLRVVASIIEASQAGAALVAFGESFIPGYPAWLSEGGGARFEDPEQADAYRRYLTASLPLDGDHVAQIRTTCRDRGITAVVGVLERSVSGGTGYCTALVIDEAGQIVVAHRKLRPTHEERLVWGPGDGHGLRTFEVRGVTCSVLNCWENWMPLPRTALYAQGTELHIGIWPGTDTNTRDITRFVAREGRVFMLSASARMSLDDVPADFGLGQRLGDAWNRNGGSAVAGPDGRWVVEPDTTTHGLVIADIEPAQVLAARQSFDATGHYSRPDVLQLSVDRTRHENATFSDES